MMTARRHLRAHHPHGSVCTAKMLSTTPTDPEFTLPYHQTLGPSHAAEHIEADLEHDLILAQMLAIASGVTPTPEQFFKRLLLKSHLEAVRHVLRDNALREALHDGGLADARLADDARVVLRAP